MTGVLSRGWDTERHMEEGRGPCEDGGRAWSDVATSQRTPGATRSWTRQKGFSSRAFREHVALPGP